MEQRKRIKEIGEWGKGPNLEFTDHLKVKVLVHALLKTLLSFEWSLLLLKRIIIFWFTFNISFRFLILIWFGIDFFKNFSHASKFGRLICWVINLDRLYWRTFTLWFTILFLFCISGSTFGMRFLFCGVLWIVMVKLSRLEVLLSPEDRLVVVIFWLIYLILIRKWHIMNKQIIII